MLEDERDLEFLRAELTRKLDTGQDVIFQTDRAAVLRNVKNPRAQYHFLVLAKEDIENVVALNHEHLPLLDHMMELANQIIGQQPLPSSQFLIGFKINAFMNRLNMHVISKDFCSQFMKTARHWNTFNSDLFMSFQAVYALLSCHRSIEPMPAEEVQRLQNLVPVHCKQCTYKTHNFRKFQNHLYFHWLRNENDRNFSNNLSYISQSLHMMQLHGNNGPSMSPQLQSGPRQHQHPQREVQQIQQRTPNRSNRIVEGVLCPGRSAGNQNSQLQPKRKPFFSSKWPNKSNNKSKANDNKGTEANRTNLTGD